MHWLRFAAVLIVAAVLQAGGLLDIISITALGLRPDLLLILLVFFAVYYDGTDAIIAVFVTGLAADIVIIGSPMGPRMIGFGLVGTALAYLHRFISIRKPLYQAIAMFVCSILVGVLAYLVTLVVSRTAAASSPAVLAGTAVYTAVVGPFLFAPLRWFMRIKTGPHRRR